MSMYHDEEWREAKQDYDEGLAEHHVLMEEGRQEHEGLRSQVAYESERDRLRLERIQAECEHRTVTTYTYRDWYETGIPEGTVCDDCGYQFPDLPEVEADERNTQ